MGTWEQSATMYMYMYSTLQKKLPINRPFNGAPVPVQAPCTPRSAPVQAPFAIIGSPVRVLCGLPVFCTAEAQVESQEDYREAFRGLRRTSALRALDSKLRSKRGRCRTFSKANSGPTSWHWYPGFQMVV